MNQPCRNRLPLRVGLSCQSLPPGDNTLFLASLRDYSKANVFFIPYYYFFRLHVLLSHVFFLNKLRR